MEGGKGPGRGRERRPGVAQRCLVQRPPGGDFSPQAVSATCRLPPCRWRLLHGGPCLHRPPCPAPPAWTPRRGRIAAPRSTDASKPWASGRCGRCGGARDLEGGPQVGPERSAAAFGVDPLAALAEDDVDLDVDQQRDDEGHVEGDDGGVHHEGGVGDDALVLLWGREGPGGISGHMGHPATGPLSPSGGKEPRHREPAWGSEAAWKRRV